MKIAMFAHLKEYHGNHKNFKRLYDFVGHSLKIRDVWMDFELYFKLCSPFKKHHTWSNDQSQRDLSCGCVSLSIG